MEGIVRYQMHMHKIDMYVHGECFFVCVFTWKNYNYTVM